MKQINVLLIVTFFNFQTYATYFGAGPGSEDIQSFGKSVNPIDFIGHSKLIGKVNTNLYQYTFSDPINFTDSTGMLTDEERKRAAKYAGAGAIVGAGIGVCAGAGVGTLAYSAVGASAGYIYGARYGLWRDFMEILNGTPAPDNIFQNFSGTK